VLVPKFKLITIAAAGTAQPVFSASDTQGMAIVGVTIQAHTGVIYIGGDTDVDLNSGIKLTTSNEPYSLPLGGDAIDLKKLYIDAATNGDKAIVLYFLKVSR
jgi:hypothetical protein